MSRSLRYVFTPGNESDVCLDQTFAAAGTLKLNGNLANEINSQVSFLAHGYSRSVSVHAANIISVTIVGIQNGVTVSDTFNTTTNTTIYRNVIYDVITSISVNGATTIRVGSGHSGFFPLIAINLERSVINYALSIISAVAVEDQIPTVVQNTLFEIVGTKPFLDLVDSEDLFQIKTENDDNDQYFLPSANVVPCRYILIQIVGAADTIDNTVSMNFIQV